jgi:hypothetical protein
MNVERVRAWALVVSANPQATAAEISSRFTQGGDDWVIVRADVVQGAHNLVVPIDAASEAAFQAALAMVQGAAGVQQVGVERVVQHYPSPTHRAHTFVTQSEIDEYPVPDFTSPGRHPKSPGSNPWG